MTDTFQAKNKTAQKREIENNDENVIEIKRIKIEIRPDHEAIVIERMAKIIEIDSKFLRFSIMILIIMFAFFLLTQVEKTYCK